MELNYVDIPTIAKALGMKELIILELQAKIATLEATVRELTTVIPAVNGQPTPEPVAEGAHA